MLTSAIGSPRPRQPLVLWVICFGINKFLITSKEKFRKLLFCLLCFMGVRFGAYEKTYSTVSEASISVVSVACAVPAFITPFSITLVQPLFFKGSMSWILIATITIGCRVGLATLLGCRWLGRHGSCLLFGQHTQGRKGALRWHGVEYHRRL